MGTGWSGYFRKMKRARTVAREESGQSDAEMKARDTRRHERGASAAQDGAAGVEACEGGAPHDVCSHGTPFVMGEAFGLRGEPKELPPTVQ